MLSKKISIRKRSLYTLGASFIIVAQFIGIYASQATTASAASATPDGPIKRLIVKYDNLPEENKDVANVTQTRAIILAQKNRLMTELSTEKGYIKVVKNLTEMPISILDVDADGEKAVRSNNRVIDITGETFYDYQLKDTIPLLGGTVANGFSDGSTNFTGTNNVVAVIDSGFNPDHLMLSGAIVSEACFSETYREYSDVIVDSACPGGVASSTAAGSATRDCPTGCNHGTAVAAAALGREVESAPDTYSGVAKNAKLIAIKATIKLQEIAGQDDFCGDGGGTVSVCFRPSLSAVLSGYNRVIQIQNDGILSDPITSLNVSIGKVGVNYADQSTCMADEDAAVDSAAITALKNANIAATFAAGNSGNTDAGNGQTLYVANANKVTYPSCLASAISVGSSIRTGGMAYYSQGGSRLDFVAPGGDLLSDGGIVLPDDGNTAIDATQGTSFAAPLMAGAWAVMREKAPTLTVDTVKRVFQETGTNVAENRDSYTVMNHKQINLDDALAASIGLPSVTSVTAESGSFVAGDSVDLAIVAENATSCSVIGGSGTTTLSGGEGVITVTATSGAQTYNIECTDDSDYAAQRSVGFVAGASTSDPFAPGTTVGTDGQVLLAVPGTPDTGLGLLMNNPIAILGVTTISALGILFMSRRFKPAIHKKKR